MRLRDARGAVAPRVAHVPAAPVNIIILDDYQDAVRKLKCAANLDSLNAKVFTNTVKGIGQLSVRLRDAEVLVLIRERTQFPRQLLEKLPKLKLIAQTGRVGPHIDVETCTRLGIAVAEGVGSPIAPAELTWALIMAAMRRLPQYIGNLKHGAWQQSGLKSASMPPNFGLGMVLQGQDARHLGLRPHRPAGRRLRQGLRHAGHRSGAARPRAQRARRRRLRRGRRAARPSSTTCDVLSLHLRLNDETRGIVTLDALSRMKPTALLVNTSRAELIEEGALVSALNRGRPGHGRGRRVRERADPAGPPAAAPRERGLHAAHRLRRAGQLRALLRAAFDNVVNFIGGKPTNIVNPDALQVHR